MTTPRPSLPAIRSEYADDADMRELVELFVSELPARLGALRSALAEERLVDLRRMAHQIKGAAGGYGFPTVGQAAGVLEASLMRAEPIAIARVRAELEALGGLCERAIAGSVVDRR